MVFCTKNIFQLRNFQLTMSLARWKFSKIGSRGESAVCGPALESLVLFFFPKLHALSEEKQTRVR